VFDKLFSEMPDFAVKHVEAIEAIKKQLADKGISL
jgi:hypothetical protein